MADHSSFLDAPDAVQEDTRHDAFLDAPDKPIRIKPPAGGLTEKQLLHIDDGAVVTNTLPKFNAGESVTRGANLLGGATTLMRGTGNIIGQAFAGTKWGDQIWPTQELDKESGGYMLGQVLDPAALAVGGVIGKGVQALPFVANATKTVEAARLAERAAPRAAQITTQVVAPAITGAATGGVVGYGASDGDTEEAAKGAGYGGLFGGTLPSVFKLGSKVIGGGIDWLTGRSGQVAAGDIARKAAGDQLPQVRAALAGAPTNITAGQAAVDVNQPSWSALDAFAKSKGGQSKYYYDLAKEQAAARQGMLSGVTPDLATAETNLKVGNTVNYGNAAKADQSRLAALQTSVRPPLYQWRDSFGMLHSDVNPPVAAPTAGAGSRTVSATRITPEKDALGLPIQPTVVGTDSAGMPIYSQPENVTSKVSSRSVPSVKTEELIRSPRQVSTIQGLEDISSTPAFKAAVEEAKKSILNNANIPPAVRQRLAEDPAASMQGLHFIKMAIDDRFKNPSMPSSLQNVRDAELTEIKSRLTGAMTASSPEYSAARQNAIELYKPVNQSKVLTNLSETLDNTVGKERVLPFTNALGRGEGSALKKSGLDARFGDTSDVLTPTQFGAVKNVEGQLIRDKTLASQATAGAGDLAGIDSRLRLPNMMNQKAALVNKVLEYADKYLNQNTYKAIAEGMRNGKTATEMLNTLPTSERNKALLIFTQVGQELGNMGTAGAVIGNSRGK
jgi:hypothetical protein